MRKSSKHNRPKASKAPMRRLVTHFAVHSSLIFSSVFSTLPIHSVSAAEEVKNSGAQTAVQVINAAGQIAMQFLGNRPMPGPCDALNPGREIIPARYFPGCAIFRAESAFPEGACEQIATPQAHGHAESCRQKAIQYKQTLSNLLSDAQNPSAGMGPQSRPAGPIKGVQCLEESQTNLNTEIENRLNALRKKANDIKKLTQMFKEQNKALVDEMSNIAQELYGSKAGDGLSGVDERNSKNGSRDFSKYFGATCKNIIGNTNLTSATTGLTGIYDGMKPLKSSADDYARNKSSYQSELNKKIAEIQAEVSKRGIGPWLQTLSEDGISGFRSVDTMMTKEIKDFSVDYTRLKNEVTSTLGASNDIFNLPEIQNLSSSFTADMADFRSGAKVYFKKKFINECVTMADKGVGLTIDQILGALEYPVTNGFGDALPKYKLALQNILESDIYMEEKLIRIRALDQQFGGNVVVNYQDSGAGYVQEPPYALFQKTVASCEAKYNEDDTYSTTDSQGMGVSSKSMAKKIEVAEQKIKEIENMSRTFIPTLMQKMSNELINCSGRSYKAETCSADGSILSPSSENFCIAHATTCSEQTTSCYQQADRLITERKTNLKNKATSYNKGVAALITQQEALLTQIRNQVLSDADFIKNYFPGATWEFPKDLFIKMPEEEMVEAFGVKIRGGDDFNLAYLDNLAKQIEETLVTTLKQQQTKMNSTIKDYIAKQDKAMQDNMRKWENLEKSCSKNMAQFEKQLAEATRKQAEQAQQANADKLEHCAKIDKILSSNPLGLCGKPGDLFEDSSRIAASLDKESASLVNQASDLCDQAQSEGLLGTEKGDEEQTQNSSIDIAAMCEAYGSETRQNIINLYTDSLPSSVQEQARRYLEDGKQNTTLLNGLDGQAKMDIISFEKSVNPGEADPLIDKVKRALEEKQGAIAGDNADGLKRQVETGIDSILEKAGIDGLANIEDIDKEDYCSRLKLNAAADSIARLRVDSNGSNVDKQIEAYDTALEKIGNRLSGPIDRSVASARSRQLEQDFSQLGENYNGACNGTASSGNRNSFLDAFDSSILGNGGLNNLHQTTIGK